MFHLISGFFNKPIDLSILDNFAFDDDSNGNGGLSNGDLGLPSDADSIDNHGSVGDIVPSPSSGLGTSGMPLAGANTFSMATGGINARDVMSPNSSSGGMTTKAYSNTITAQSNTMMQQMPVSTLGTPTPATPHLSADKSMKRSSEQTPQNGGMLSSLANSMPVSFGYSVQSTMANALMQRNLPNTGVVGSNLHSEMNMINKMQMPMQNMNFPPQNTRFGNGNNMQMMGPGTVRMPNGPNPMFVNPAITPAMLKMQQSFQNNIVARQMANNPQQHTGMPAMNGPVGVQNMAKFQMNNNPMMTQVFIMKVFTILMGFFWETIREKIPRSFLKSHCDHDMK